MATIRFSTFPTAKEEQIVQAVGAATVTSNIELTVDMGNTMEGSRPVNREEVILAVRRLLDYLVSHTAIP